MKRLLGILLVLAASLAFVVALWVRSCGKPPQDDVFFAACRAIDRDSPSELKAVLLKAPDVVAMRDGFDQSTLMHRISTKGLLQNSYEMAKLLVEHGADANAEDATGATPLDLAIRFKAPDIYVNYLMGVSTEASSESESSASEDDSLFADPWPIPFQDRETGSWGFRDRKGAVLIPAAYLYADASWNGGFSWVDLGSCSAKQHPGWHCAREKSLENFGTFLRPDGTPLFSFHAHPVSDFGNDMWVFVPPRFEHGLAFVRFPDGLVRGITTNGLPLPLHEQYGGFVPVDSPGGGDGEYIHYRGEWALVELTDGRAGVLGPDHDFTVGPSNDMEAVAAIWKTGLKRLDPFQFEGADRVPWLRREMTFGKTETMTLETFLLWLTVALNRVAPANSGWKNEGPDEPFQRRIGAFIDHHYKWGLGQKTVRIPAGTHTVRSLLEQAAEQTHCFPRLARQWIEFIELPEDDRTESSP